MERHRRRFLFDPRDMLLERREVLSGLGTGTGIEALAFTPHLVRPQNFHHQYVRLLTGRLTNSAFTAVQVNNAFQAFVQNYLGIPVSAQGPTGSNGLPTNGSPGTMPPGGAPASAGVVPVGTIPSPPTLANFIALLDQQVSSALSTFTPTTNRLQPSVAHAPRIAPHAPLALVPFAQAQIAQLGQTLAAHPPTFDSNGNLTSPESYAAVNTAFNAIMNAVAENSVHPSLFTSPDDFYINPAAKFTIPFTSTPANAFPNFYLLGPHGIPLPGTNGFLRRFPTR